MTSIEIVAGERRWTAHISDTPSANDFLAQLPLELTLKDFGGNEKIADLPRTLTRKDAPDAITPKAGDIAFYAPWGNLAIFYRDGHHSPGLILLGQIEGQAATLAIEALMKVTIRQASALSGD
ncbi:MAG TPA: cyclophilin-like fold protein [Acidobacteriaceae bacterium]